MKKRCVSCDMKYWGGRSEIRWWFLVLVLILAFLPQQANRYSYALPAGAEVQEGSATFESPDAATLNITTSHQAVIQWQSFNIASNEIVNFYQPLSSSSVLNRVIGGGPSEIAGMLNANGSVILVNPAGISFAETAQINVGSLIASSLNISNENFMAGDYVFQKMDGFKPGSIINAGEIYAARPGGVVALLGGIVENRGNIIAELGSVALLSGNKMTLSFDPKGYLMADVTEAVSEDVMGEDHVPLTHGVLNAGHIEAKGGKVILSGEQVSGIFQRLVNQTGVIEASSVENQNGHIVLLGKSGIVVNAGEMHADGTPYHPNAGLIEVLGDKVAQLGYVSANAYEGGMAGTINLVSETYTDIYNLSRTEARGVAGISDGGIVYVNALNGHTNFRPFAVIDASGGPEGGEGGFVELSASKNLAYDGEVKVDSVDGRYGTILLDPATITITGGTLDGSDTPDLSSATLSQSALGQVLFADTGVSDPFLVFESEIESTAANITLQATGTINVSGVFTGGLVLGANRNITLQTRNNSGEGIGGIDLSGGIGFSITTSGTGTITIQSGTGGTETGNAPVVLSALTSGNGAITVSAEGTLTVGGAITTGNTTTSGTPSRNISLTSTNADVIINADVNTGTASVADAAGGQTAVSGNITVSAGTSVTGTGRLITGTAAITGAGAAGADSATSGDITVTAGTAGTTGGIMLSNANALTIGTAQRIGSATDTANAGTITLTSDQEVNNGTSSTAMAVTVGLASGAGTNNQGRLNVTTTQSTGNIFITSASALQMGTIATTAGSSQTVDISTTGTSNLTLLNVAETLSGDIVNLSTATGTSILTIANGSFNIGTGDLTITSDEINFTGGGNSITGSGTLTIQPAAAGVSVGVGGGAGTLDVSDTDLAAITNGWSDVIIGRSDGTALMTISSSTFRDPVTFRMPGASGDITLNGGALTTAAQNEPITIIAGTGDTGTFTQTAGAGNTIASGTGAITIVADSIVLNTTANTITGTGTITLRPATASRPIVVGAAGAATDFALSTTEVAAITNGFSGITIGDSTSGTGSVTISATTFNDNLILVGGSIASNGLITNTGNTVTMTARVTNITDGNGAAGNITAATANLNAVTGIGSADALETTVTTMTFSNTTSGDVQVSNSGALALSGTQSGGNLSITTTGAITNPALISVSGTSSFTAGANAITLTNASNDFTGAVSLSNSGANNVSVTDTNAIVLGTSGVGTGTLTVNAVGITQTGAITQSAAAGTATFNAGAGVITLGSANNFTGAVGLNNSGANNVSVTDTNAIILGTSAVGTGTLTVNAVGITQSGVTTITQAAGAGTATFNAGAGVITLGSANDFTGSVSLNNSGANNVSVTDTNAIILGTSAVGTGTLTVNTVGITQTGAMTQSAAAGTATFNAGAGVITLTNANNFTGSVSLNNSGANNVSVTDTNAIVLGTSGVGTGTLTVSAVGITQTGAMTQSAAAGTATFNAGAGVITLGSANNFTGSVSLNNSGANNVSVTDMNAIVLGTSGVGTGTLTVNAVGITQTGSITQAAGAGAATFNGGAGVITLTDAGNDFRGSVSLNNSGLNNVSVTDANAIVLGTSAVGLGTLTVNAVGITQTGAITQAVLAGSATFNGGAGVVTLTSANDFTGVVSLNNSGANNVSVTDANAIILGASAVGSGTFTVNTSGAITQTGAITQSASAGTATFNAGGNPITLTNVGNDFTGAVSLNNSGVNSAAVTDLNSIILGTSSVGLNLSVIAGGDITQTGALTVPGILTLAVTSAGSDILLGTQANDITGTITFSGVLANFRDVSIRNTNAGALVPSFTGLTSLRNLTLQFNNAAIAMPATTLTGGGNLSLTAGGAITQTGALIIPGASSFTTGSFAITLTNGANNFTGAVSLTNTGGSAIAITDANTIDLGTVNASGALNVNTTGAITDSGTVIVTGTATLAAGAANNITLDSASNNFSTVAITSGNDVTLVDTNAIDLGASTVSGILDLTAGGTITQSGALVITGASTFTLPGGNDVTLTNAGNNFGGAVSFVSNGGGNLNNISVVDTTAFDIQAITIDGNLSVTAGGPITDSGAIVVAGASTFAAGAGNDVTLNFAANNFNSVTVTSVNDVTLVDTNAITLTSIVTSGSGNVDVTAGGNILAGTVDAGTGNVTLNATGGSILDSTSAVTGDVMNFTAGAVAGSIGVSGTPINTTANTLNLTAGSGGAFISNTGSVSLNAPTIGAGGSISIVSSGVLSLPNTDITLTGSGSINFVSNGGNLAMNGNLTTDSGSLTLSASGVLTVGDDITTGSGNITLIADNDSSGAGDFDQNNNDDIVSVSGNIFISGAQTTSVRNISTGGAGTIQIFSTTLDISQNNGTTVSSAAGNITMTAPRQVTIANVSTTSGNMFFTADSTSTGTGDFTQRSGTSITSTSGSITITGAQTTTLDNISTGGAGTITADSTTGAVTQRAGTTIQTAGGNITISSLAGSGNVTLATVDAGTGDITVTAVGSGSDILAQGGSPVWTGDLITLTADNNNSNVGTSGNPINTSAVTINATAQGGGIFINETDGVDISGLTTTAGNGDISFTAGGSITTSGAISADGNGTVTITANGAASSITLGSSLASGSGAVALSVPNGITLSGAGADVTTTGTYTVNADSDASGAGVYSQNNAGSAVNSGAVSITASDIVLTGTIDSGAANVDLIPSTAGATIGVEDASKDFNVTDAELDNITATGLITIGVSTNTGGMTIGVDGAISQGTKNFALITGGNISVGNNSFMTTGNITMTADADATGTGSISSGTGVMNSGLLTVSAAQGIVLNTNVTALNLTNTTGGNITVVESDGVDLSGVSQSVGDFSLTANGAVTDSGTITVSGTSTLAAGAADDITLNTAANDFGTVSILSGNNVTLVDANALVLGASTVSGNYNVTAGSHLTESGVQTVTGTSTFTVTSANSDILLDTQANDFGGTITVTDNGNVRDLAVRNVNATAAVPSLPSALRNLTLVFDNAAITLPAVTLTGDLTVTAGGDITDSGAFVVSGSTTLTAGANNIVLNSAANDFSIVSIISGNNVTLMDANAIDLGASTVSGTLSVNTSGAITDSGNLLVTGAATFTAGAGNDITLNSAGNDFSTVSINSGNNVTLVDANAIDLGTSTVSGSLSVTSSGAITDSGALSVTGTANFTAGPANDITLNDAGNDFSTVLVTSGNNVIFVDQNSINFGLSAVSGTLSVTSNGTITDSGDISVTGAATFSAGAANDITLNSAGNDFSTVLADGNHVTLVDANALVLGFSNVAGNLNVTTGGNLTQSGLLTISGTSTFTFTSAASDLLLNTLPNVFDGTITVTDNGNVRDIKIENISVNAAAPSLPANFRDLTLIFNSAAVTIPSISLTGDMVISAGGDITQSGAIVVAGTATFTATANNITLTNAGNDFSTVLVSSAVNVTLVDANAIDLGASVISGTLDVTTSGAITDSGNLSVTGTATFVAGAANDITLNSAGNDFSTVFTTTANNVTLVDVNAIAFEGGTISGNLIVTSNGAITNSASMTVGGTATFTAGAANNITLNGVSDFATFRVVSGNNVAVYDLNGIDLGASTISGTFDVTASGDVTDSGALVVTGTTQFFVTDNITLDNAGNDFSTVVNTSGNTSMTIVDVNGIDLGPTNVGILSITAGGAITDSGPILPTGMATFAAGAANNITLDNSNDFSTVSIVSGNNVTLNDINALDLGVSTVSGTLDVTTAGAITDSGEVVVSGTTTLTAGAANDITLDNANDFSTLSITSGNSVTLNDINALDLGVSTVSGTLDITADGTISQSGALSVTGGATFTATSGGDVMLTDGGNDFSTVSASTTAAGEVQITDSNSITVDTITTAGGNVTVTADTNDMLVGIVNAGAGDLTLTATTGSILDNGSSITGNNLVLMADGDIGFGTPLLTAVNTLDALSTGVGEIAIEDVDGLTVLSAVTTLGEITIVADAGNISVGTVNAACGACDVNLVAVGGSILDAGSSITAFSLLLIAGGADGDIGQSGSSLNTNADFIDATASGTGEIFITESNGASVTSLITGGGAISVTSTAGDLFVGVVNSGAGNVTLTASSGDLLDAGSAITGNVVSLNAGGADGDIGDLGSPLNTTVSSINAAATGTGEIFITESDGASLPSVTTGGGSITITSTSGDVSVGTVNAGAGDITLTAGSGDILSSGSAITGDTITLTAGGADGDVGVTGSPMNTFVSTINAAATGTGEIRISQTGDVTLGSVTTGGGPINISAGSNMIVGTVNAGTGAVTLSATGAGGSILDGNGGANNITAGANSSLSASGTIGTALTALDVIITGATLTVAAGGIDSGVSVNINGTVTPSNTLNVPVFPSGLVLFNGIPITPPAPPAPPADTGSELSSGDLLAIFNSLDQYYRFLEDMQDKEGGNSDPFIDKKKWSFAYRTRFLS